MKFTSPAATLHIPNHRPEPAAFTATTHLGIGAHQDDLEIMAFHGISACFDRTDQWFAGIICTDGRGSPQKDPAATIDGDDLSRRRQDEQTHAADLGRYAWVAQLNYRSNDLRCGPHPGLLQDVVRLLDTSRPRAVYTHNPADRHATHVAVCAATIEAIRQLPLSARPQRLYGCEVWRSLDWLDEPARVELEIGDHPGLAGQLLGCFTSQIEAGKRYDRATPGRALSNATFADSHQIDQHRMTWLAMDLSPLILDDGLGLSTYVSDHLDRFRANVKQALAPYCR